MYQIPSLFALDKILGMTILKLFTSIHVALITLHHFFISHECKAAESEVSHFIHRIVSDSDEQYPYVISNVVL